ncbi:hypothetical protein F2Q68_00006315 [Brassica cretica]|uniref:Dolichyl-diphosphooligosaccharide--protein glycosyltransferase subunit 2 n=1 Tax=Brassica cretica TaxID=69181 RepID=A0A8S9JGG2_BRACR|nr:hypothetical protein F2Q68_00006315 [Brassica cretica]
MFVLYDFRFAVPLILSLPSTVISVTKKEPLKVKVITVLGSKAPALNVKLAQALCSGSKGSVINNQELKFDADSATYFLDSFPKNFDVGKYTFVFELAHEKVYITEAQTKVPIAATELLALRTQKFLYLTVTLEALNLRKKKAPRPPLQPTDPYSRYGPKAEISHIFRVPEKLPAKQLSLVFLGLIVLPFIAFLIGLTRLGVNIKSFPSLVGAATSAVLLLYVLFLVEGKTLFDGCYLSRRAMSHSAASSGKRRIRDLLTQSDNRVCADCGAPDPKWASANIGVFICLKCCGVHRSLGTHVSKVLSVTLDEWSDEEVDSMIEIGGNASANSIYEAFIPDGSSKPGPDASHDHRMRFIRSKYEFQEFLKPSLRITSGKTSSTKSSSYRSSSLSSNIIDSFRTTSSSQKPQLEGMVEFIGLLKVTLKKGTNLAIRDMMTSDPYVVLTLGQQTAQSTVMKSNLNPVWNEELMLSVPHDYGSVKLQVFDYDTFSADDIMGEAEIDIQPLITSAMAFGDPEMFGDMQIGKWLKSNDNALIEDSIINIADGKVKQEVQIKLQNVESGELELELEWLPLDQ